MEVSKKLKKKIKELPLTPGVYQFLDDSGEIIYVGKANDLKRRVSSYFQGGRARDNRLMLLVSRIRDLRIIRTASEAEALIYEAGLIKDHAPKFNVDLKDDKSYPFLKLTVNERYPRLYITRRRRSDGATYYGPYVDVTMLKHALSFMKKVFPLRSCNRMPGSLCLEFHIGQCRGPCEDRVSEEEYHATVDQLKKFLEGKKDDLLGSLQEEMNVHSAEKRYEKAITVKKRIEALTAIRNLHDRSQQPVFGELDELKNTVGLASVPVSIECFDVSNISGEMAVGSMVRFVAGVPRKSEYRKFRIKAAEGIDDYSMMKEIVRRRYSRLIEEKRSLPDLVLIDGGRGHLSAVKSVMEELGLWNVPVASIAKEFNHLYIVGRSRPLRLSPGSLVLLLIQRIRDEAHRFAITYHRKLRNKRGTGTGLRDISGIGEVREKFLLERFGTPDALEKATPDDLLKAGIDKKTAGNIVRYFKEKRTPARSV